MTKILIDEATVKLMLGKIKAARDCHPNAVDTLLFEAEEILETELAEQPAQQEPVACLIGTKGSAFDSPETKRAYTYANQPGNVVAYKIGSAYNEAGKQRAGDNIDRGLGLLQELQKEGFGVFSLGAEYTVTQQEPTKDQVQAAFEDWLASTCPSGDAETVQRQWESSSAYTDLYTSPPAQRKPLTDMQVDGEWILVRDLDTNDVEKSRLFARVIEAAHGIKENT